MFFRLFLLFGLTSSLSASVSHDVQLFCRSHSPQKGLEVGLLMGRWYVIEVINHMMNERHRLVPYVNLKDCPTIHLLQEDFSNLKLVWSESSRTVHYVIKIVDPGSWIASGPHNETLVDHSSHYHQFTGQIEVMKAVGNHAVLTFCKSDHEHSHLFSAVLARDRWLPRVEMHGVNNMLQRRGLPPVLIKRTCSAGTISYATTYLIFLTILLKQSLF